MCETWSSCVNLVVTAHKILRFVQTDRQTEKPLVSLQQRVSVLVCVQLMWRHCDDVIADALTPIFPPSTLFITLLLLFHFLLCFFTLPLFFLHLLLIPPVLYLPPPPAGSPPSTEVPEGPYPFMVTSEDGRQVPVVQAFAFGKYLGFLKVTFNNDGEVVKVSGNPILLDSSVPQGEPARSC